MTPEEMRMLYDYNAWANHRSLDAASSLTAEQFAQPMGSSFRSVRDTLAHIYGAEWVWLERFPGPLAFFPAGHNAIQGCGQLAGALERTRNAAA